MEFPRDGGEEARGDDLVYDPYYRSQGKVINRAENALANSLCRGRGKLCTGRSVTAGAVRRPKPLHGDTQSHR